MLPYKDGNSSTANWKNQKQANTYANYSGGMWECIIIPKAEKPIFSGLLCNGTSSQRFDASIFNEDTTNVASRTKLPHANGHNVNFVGQPLHYVHSGGFSV